MPRKPAPGLPTRKQILDFIATSDVPAGKREMARAFGLKGHDKIALKSLLKDMADEGLIELGARPRLPQDGRGAQGDGAARGRRSTTAAMPGACPSNGMPKPRRRRSA